MELLINESDDLEFVELVEQVISACAHQSAADQIFVVKIDNWFDRKWLGFSGRGRVWFPFVGIYDLDTALDGFRQDQITEKQNAKCFRQISFRNH